MVDFLLQAMFDDTGMGISSAKPPPRARDVEHHVRLNDDSKIEAPNAEDLFRVFGLSIPEKFENRWKNK
jgi:hypothetical protein